MTTTPELLAVATDRERLRPPDARSGAVFERFRVGERRYFLKRLRPDDDWITRVTGDRDFRTAKAWRAGLMRRAEAAVVHAVLAVAVVDGELAVLMDDVGDRLVPPGDAPVARAVHHALLDGLAGLAATFAGWRDDVGLVPMADRFRFFAPDHIAEELCRPDADGVLRAAAADGPGWTSGHPRWPRSSGRCTGGRSRWPPRSRAHPRRSCTATRRWATSASRRTGARSCWTGPTPARAPRPGSSGGTWP